MLSTARLILRPFVLDDVRKVFAMSLEAGCANNGSRIRSIATSSTPKKWFAR